MTECRECGYVRQEDDYPLMDDGLCEDCHFAELQQIEAEEASQW